MEFDFTWPTHIIEAAKPRYKEAGTIVYLQETRDKRQEMLQNLIMVYVVKLNVIQELGTQYHVGIKLAATNNQ